MKLAIMNDGSIHFISPINTEFTLCGDAFDGDANTRPDEPDPLRWREVKAEKRAKVNCCKCIKIVEEAKKMKLFLDRR